MGYRMEQSELTINGRLYKKTSQPVVVICIDGNAPQYFSSAVENGRMPFIKELIQKGYRHESHCVIPSFTNPNNMSIITGVAPALHGICGNFYFDGQQDVMMTDPDLLKAPTILEAFHQAGAKVIAVTAKDKLRAMLSHGLEFNKGRAICFSSEKADLTTLKEHGIENAEAFVGMPAPDVYSPELSEFVFKAGVKLLEQEQPDLMYLTTTDFIQHTFAPEQEGALSFYEMLDGYFAQLHNLGAKIVITADHGMNAKTDKSGAPNILFIDEILSEYFPANVYRTILPITDPYIAHHSALGSFAAVYVENQVVARDIGNILTRQKGIAEVLSKSEAAEKFELDPGRIGDLILLAKPDFVLGKSRQHHDLGRLHGTLRSHGGISEQSIPLVTNFSIPESTGKILHNFDAFYLAMQ